MLIAYIAIASVLAMVMTAAAIAVLRRQRHIIELLDAVRAPRWLPTLLIGALLAGALGLVVGIAVPQLGLAAALCTCAYFTGAIGAHVRVGRYDIAPAATLLVLGIAAVVTRVVS